MSTDKTTKQPKRAHAGPLRGIAVNPSLRGNGKGPKPGALNAGRPRDEWKAWLRSLVDSPLTRASIETILQDPTHPAFPRVLGWADERGFGKETQPIEATVTELVVIRRDESAHGAGA